MQDPGDRFQQDPGDRSRSSPGERCDPAKAAEDRLEHALGLAFRQLNRRDRTVSEIEHHLAAQQVEADVAGRAVKRLCEQGYLDDARFARLFIADKRELEQWGNERITRTLRKRGIDQELIDGELAEGAADGELARALTLLRRRFPCPPRDRRERERALGMMVRKGFDSELAMDALSSYRSEAEEPSLS
jgi:regulatory protein